MEKVWNRVYLAIFSKWPIKSYELAVPGHWLDDGIVKAVLDTSIDLGYDINIYNVHTVGGIFNKPPDLVQQNRRKRISELKSLNNRLVANKEKNNTVIISGDFNLDSNDAINYPKGAFLPENEIDGFCDVWSEKGPENDLGNTESHAHNPLRKDLKPGQDREARYDKIIYSKTNILPENIKLSAQKQLEKIKMNKVLI